MWYSFETILKHRNERKNIIEFGYMTNSNGGTGYGVKVNGITRFESASYDISYTVYSRLTGK